MGFRTRLYLGSRANCTAGTPMIRGPMEMSDQLPECPRTLSLLARYYAKQAVKKALVRKGIRLSHVPSREISALARDYLSKHLAELTEEAKEIVRSDPRLRKVAQREARERER